MTDAGPGEQTIDPTSFDDVFSNPRVADGMKGISPTSHEAAAALWRVPFASGHLSPRIRELVLFAMHASATALNADAIKRQVTRIQAAGGALSDIVDVLITIVSLANHALYDAVPVLDEEWAAAGNEDSNDLSADLAFETAKRRFIEIRGFWNSANDPIARYMPDYFSALTGVSTESWQRGSLTVKERELVCIGIDCTVTHSYPPGLRRHIRAAIREGATREQIFEVFQLAALMGLEGYILSAEALFGNM